MGGAAGQRSSMEPRKEPEAESWIETEVAAGQFADERHGQRLRRLLEQFSGKVGAPTPWACQDWANTKAAYRFFDNDRIDEAQILAGHFAATRERFAAARSSPLLVLHDTTEFIYHREDPESIGLVHRAPNRNKRSRQPPTCGVLMHSSLVTTPEGQPLGLAAIKFWSRKAFHRAADGKLRTDRTKIPIAGKESARWLENMRQATALLGDPGRCVHIGDRESDLYDLFHAAGQADTHFLVRTCTDRLTGAGGHTVAQVMSAVPVQGLHRVQGRDKRGKPFTATLEIRYRRLWIWPPAYKRGDAPKLSLTVLHAQERDAPQGREKIDWKLLTDLPVLSRKQAIEKLEWYAQRWKIETFHKILKSGCRAEEAKLRTYGRLVNLISILSLLSWRIFWITMLNRTDPSAPPEMAFTELEQYLLEELVPDRSPPVKELANYIDKLARLGGYLARAHDPPPGNTVIWRGLSRLTDIQLGIMIGVQLVGN